MQCFCLRRSDVDDNGTKLSLNYNKNYSRSELKFPQNLDSLMQCERSTISRQLKFGKDTPRLIDVKGLGCPKEFSDRDEDFQLWSKKTEAFFAGVIKESEMMLVWSAEQAAEITTELIDLEFLPSSTNVKRGVRNPEFVLQQMHTALMALTDYHSNDIVANSRKNPLEGWRRVQKRNDPTTGGRTRNFLRTIISPGRCSLLQVQGRIKRWESYVSNVKEKLKDKVDDEIKLAGLEALVPEELEKHLILNSNRLRTFEDARLEIVTYVEAKLGLRNRDSKPSDTGPRGHSDPMDVDAVNSFFIRQSKRCQRICSFPSVIVTTQDGTHCRSSWKGSTQTSSDDARSGCQVLHGSTQRMGLKHCKTPRLCFVVLSRAGHGAVGICVFFVVVVFV